MTNSSNSKERPPIVVVMGHVDHGKSTLLDFIRKSNVVAGEAGGITQHVAAYEVAHTPATNDKRQTTGPKLITFIDTPGHAAFQAIRSRGTNVADIAILVVAADDGVKAQTIEALASIRESGIPFVVAINKIDKPNADISRTQSNLLEKGIFLEKLGGDVPWVAVSARIGTGVNELLDLVLLVAELQELRGDFSKPATGYVIEAHRDSKRGIAATLIVRDGTLKSGMAVQAGRAIAPVRIMENQTGKAIKEASFSTPILLVGFDELPAVGVAFETHKNRREAEEARSKAFANLKRTDDVPADKVIEGQFVLPIIVRADTSGSLEAIVHEVSRIQGDHSAVRIVQSEIGNISENDIKAAVASSLPATVIGFNVAVDASAREMARQHTIAIETFEIIYKLVERLAKLLQNAAPKRHVEESLGRAKVLKQFGSRKDAHVIGGSVILGKIERGCSVRVTRRKVEVGIGKISNLQSHKQNVDRIETGGEFGAEITSPFDIVEGDMLDCFSAKVV